MTLHQLRIVRNFFSARDKEIDNIVTLTLSNMFALAPDAASAFKAGAETQCPLFTKMFRKIIELTRASHLWPVSVQTGHVLIPGLAAIRTRHASAGVKPEYFGLMKTALLQVLEKSYPADFTAEVRNAFGFVFDVLTKSLIEIEDSEAEADPLKNFSRPEREVAAGGVGFGQFLYVPAAE